MSKPIKPGNPKKIKKLQTILSDLGLYEGDIDGSWGPKSQEALKEFQDNPDNQESGLIPPNAKSLMKDLFGMESNITERALSEDQLSELQKIVRSNLKKGKSTISYEDYNTEELALADGTAPKSEGKLTKKGQLTDSAFILKSLIGQGDIVVTPKNDTLVVDRYNFNDSTGEGNISDLSSRIKKNPSMYGIARAFGSEYGSPEGEGNNVIIKTNEQDKEQLTMGGKIKKKKYKYGGSILKEKYATGGKVQHFIESPSTAIAESNIMMAQARSKAENNGWAKGLEMFGGMAMEQGMATMQGGGVSGFLPQAKHGGKFSHDVEVEGGEVANLPNGDMVDFQGPDHKDGGIPVSLPDETEVYSKRIIKEGESMADREKNRHAQESKLEKLLNKTSSDVILQKSLERTKQNNDMAREQDLEIQKAIKEAEEQKQLQDEVAGLPKLKFGDKLGPGLNNFFAKTFGGKTTDGQMQEGMNMTLGDAMGMMGTFKAGNDAMSNTEAARASDTANINAFEGFGQDGINTIKESESYIQGQQQRALQDLDKSRARIMSQNRKTASGINQMRAMDLAAESKSQDAKIDVYDNFSKNMMGLLSQKAGFENTQDQMVMQGEQQRDLADRMDKDAYYTQRGQDLQTKNTGTQQLAKMFNQRKFNQDSMNAINNSNADVKIVNGKYVDKNGNEWNTFKEAENSNATN
jgi:hypothetical protein